MRLFLIAILITTAARAEDKWDWSVSVHYLGNRHEMIMVDRAMRLNSHVEFPKDRTPWAKAKEETTGD